MLYYPPYLLFFLIFRMPVVPVNLLALLASVVASMVLGSLWFGPLFGKAWMKMMGMSKDKMTSAQKKSMGNSYAIMALGSLLTAYVMQHSLVFASTYLHIYGLNAGLMTGFWNWAGFIAPSTVGMVLWEGKPWKLWCLVAGYWLVQLLLTGAILASM